jgi:putative transposase
MAARAELVAVVDIATRTISAAVLQPAGAKVVDADLLLARMMVPEPMRPAGTSHGGWRRPGCRMPGWSTSTGGSSWRRPSQ